jgi:hypothetical protein
MYRWEFERDGEAIEMAVPGTITFSETRVGLGLVTGGPD